MIVNEKKINTSFFGEKKNKQLNVCLMNVMKFLFKSFSAFDLAKTVGFYTVYM